MLPKPKSPRLSALTELQDSLDEDELKRAQPKAPPAEEMSEIPLEPPAPEVSEGALPPDGAAVEGELDLTPEQRELLLAKLTEALA